MNPMKQLKQFVLVFVTILGLVVPASYAKIGDTELKVVLSNYGSRVTRDTIDERAKVVVFTTDKGQYAVGILDGIVESEIWTNVDDATFDKQFVMEKLRAYHEVWYPVTCEPNCYAVMSADAGFFAKYGPSKELSKDNVFWIFSETWKKYVLTKKQPKI